MTTAPSLGCLLVHGDVTFNVRLTAMLNTSWYSLLDVLGHVPMISRPGYTAFALQTHTYNWNFVSVGADANPSLCDDGWFDGSSVSPVACSFERGACGTNDKENKVQQQHPRDDEQNIGICVLQPHAPQEHINQLPALRPLSNPNVRKTVCQYFDLDPPLECCSLQNDDVTTTTSQQW